jgi:prepilin-type N-terminal cleavage/methylation domain-containing protein
VRRGGLTLLEVLVVLAVIGLLLGLLLPAIQASRESARRTQCVSREKQIGLAISSFEALHGSYGGQMVPVMSSGSPKLPVPSYHARLLPHLDQTPLFSRIDFTDTESEVTGAGPASTKNASILAETVPVFHCPSDPRAVGGANSYRFCTGTSPGAHETVDRRPCVAALGGFTTPKLRAAGIKDGLSNTVFLSEHPVGDGAAGPFDFRRDLLLAGNASFMTPDDAETSCAALKLPCPAGRRVGLTWLIGGYLSTWYNHITPPNSAIPDCQAADVPSGGAPCSIVARSEHKGGVHALLGDGSVRFFANATDTCIWRALATVDGAEPAAGE